MKNLCLAFGILFASCAEKEILPIDYRTALNSCIPDTMQFIKSDGSEETVPYYKPDCVIGSQMPSFRATTMNNQVVDSTYFANKVSVLNFWFIGCQPCEAEMPGFNDLVKKYQDQPVQFLSISRNREDHIIEFLAKKPFNMEHVANGEPIYQDTFQGKWGYPITFVADKQGKIVYASSGGRVDSLAITEVQANLIPVIDEALNPKEKVKGKK